MNTLSGVLGGLTNNFVIEQIVGFNLAGTVINTALGPYLQALSNTLNSVSPFVPNSPQELAMGVIRNIISEDAAASEAAMSGIDSTRFARLVALSGDAPAPEALAEALRRNIITEQSYLRGIQQGRLRDEWQGVIRELAVREPSPMDAMTALVEGQIDEATARSYWHAFGGDPKHFDWMFGTVGAGPSPVEAATMANRGVIPWDGEGLGVVSFTQAVHEGHSRNKWLPAWRALAEYLPPPRTVTAMVREGALTHAQGIDILRKHGLTAELAAAYLVAASTGKTTKARELSESTTLKLYRDKLVTRAQATSLLESAGYTAAEAGYILEVEDYATEATVLAAAASKVRTLYVAHKISHAAAAADLAALGVDAAGIERIMAILDIERAANVRTLTEAQIVDAWHLTIIGTRQATAELMGLGYSETDAVTLLAIKNKGPLSPDQQAT